jgi:RND family efflux transporter MFP subunit
MRYLLLIVVVVLCLSLPQAGCEKRRASKPRLGEVERLPRVETVLLGRPAKLEISRSYTATLEALEKAELTAMVKGVVKDLSEDLDIGRSAQKDEKLFSLHVPDLVAELNNKAALVEQNEKAEAAAIQAVEVARAEVKETRALLLRYEGDVEFRRAQHTRIAKLAQGDTLSKQQLDEAKLQLDASASALAAASAQVTTKENRLEGAQKERALAAARVKAARTDEAKARVQVEFADIVAPFHGVITKRWVDSGATVNAGMPIFTFVRTDKLRVILDVPERDVPYLRAGPDGNPARVRIPALKEAAGTEELTGAINLMSAALDPVTRTLRTEIHLPNKVGNKVGLLKPQMTGTAHVSLAVREALTVPASALVRSGDKLEIYIVADPAGEPLRGTLKRVEVQSGLDDGMRVEIRSDQLRGTELVVVKGSGMLRPGEPVLAVQARIGE